MRTRTVKPDGDKLNVVWNAIATLQGASKVVCTANIIDLVRDITKDENYPPSRVHGAINWLEYAGYIRVAGKNGTALSFETLFHSAMKNTFSGKQFELGGAEHQRRMNNGKKQNSQQELRKENVKL